MTRSRGHNEVTQLSHVTLIRTLIHERDMAEGGRVLESQLFLLKNEHEEAAKETVNAARAQALARGLIRATHGGFGRAKKRKTDRTFGGTAPLIVSLAEVFKQLAEEFVGDKREDVAKYCLFLCYRLAYSDWALMHPTDSPPEYHAGEPTACSSTTISDLTAPGIAQLYEMVAAGDLPVGNQFRPRGVEAGNRLWLEMQQRVEARLGQKAKILPAGSSLRSKYENARSLLIHPTLLSPSTFDRVKTNWLKEQRGTRPHKEEVTFGGPERVVVVDETRRVGAPKGGGDADRPSRGRSDRRREPPARGDLREMIKGGRKRHSTPASRPQEAAVLADGSVDFHSPRSKSRRHSDDSTDFSSRSRSRSSTSGGYATGRDKSWARQVEEEEEAQDRTHKDRGREEEGRQRGRDPEASSRQRDLDGARAPQSVVTKPKRGPRRRPRRSARRGPTSMQDNTATPSRPRKADDRTPEDRHPNFYWRDHRPPAEKLRIPLIYRRFGDSRAPPPSDAQLEHFTFDFDEAIKARKEPWAVVYKGVYYDLRPLADHYWCDRSYGLIGSGDQTESIRREVLLLAIAHVRELKKNPNYRPRVPTWLEILKNAHEEFSQGNPRAEKWEVKLLQWQTAATNKLLDNIIYDPKAGSGPLTLDSPTIVKINASAGPFQLQITEDEDTPGRPVPPDQARARKSTVGAPAPAAKPRSGTTSAAAGKAPAATRESRTHSGTVQDRMLRIFTDPDLYHNASAAGYGFTQLWPDLRGFAKATEHYAFVHMLTRPSDGVPEWAGEVQPAANLSRTSAEKLAMKTRQAIRFPCELGALMLGAGHVQDTAWELPGELLCAAFRVNVEVTMDRRLNICRSQKEANPGWQNKLYSFVTALQYWAEAAEAPANRPAKRSGAVAELMAHFRQAGVPLDEWKVYGDPLPEYAAKEAGKHPIPLTETMILSNVIARPGRVHEPPGQAGERAPLGIPDFDLSRLDDKPSGFGATPEAQASKSPSVYEDADEDEIPELEDVSGANSAAGTSGVEDMDTDQEGELLDYVDDLIDEDPPLAPLSATESQRGTPEEEGAAGSRTPDRRMAGDSPEKLHKDEEPGNEPED